MTDSPARKDGLPKRSAARSRRKPAPPGRAGGPARRGCRPLLYCCNNTVAAAHCSHSAFSPAGLSSPCGPGQWPASCPDWRVTRGHEHAFAPARVHGAAGRPHPPVGPGGLRGGRGSQPDTVGLSPARRRVGSPGLPGPAPGRQQPARRLPHSDRPVDLRGLGEWSCGRKRGFGAVPGGSNGASASAPAQRHRLKPSRPPLRLQRVGVEAGAPWSKRRRKRIGTPRPDDAAKTLMFLRL